MLSSEKEFLVKINSGVGSAGKTADSGKSRASAQPQRPAASPQGAQVEQVAISPLSSRLNEIEASLASAPPVNAERVAEIKRAIAEGRFKIDSGRIADGLLASVRQMLAKNG